MRKLFTLFFLFIFSVLFSQTYVIDCDSLLTNHQRNTLNQSLLNYWIHTHIETFVLVVSKIDNNSNVNTFRNLNIGYPHNTGILLVVSGDKKWQCITGSGLNSLITEDECKQIGNNSFNDSVLFNGTVTFLTTIQDKIGHGNYQMMIAYKKIKEKYDSAIINMWLRRILISFIVAFILIGFYFFVKHEIKRRREAEDLRIEIEILITNIEQLKSDLFNDSVELTSNIQDRYDKLFVLRSISPYLPEYKSHLQYLYNRMLDVKKLINTTKSEIRGVHFSINNAKSFLKNKYDFCGDYLMNDLEGIIPDTNTIEFTSKEYTERRLKYLIGTRTIFDKKFKTFLNKTYKINSIVSEYKNFGIKISELDKLNENYNNKRNLLTKMNIGKKDNSLVKIDYNAEKIRLTNDINTAFEKLRNNEYDNADSNYTNYITRLAVINGAFNSADSLLSTAEKSDIYVRDNKINISKSVEKIDRKINSTGVLNMRKDSYKAIKSLIDGYNIASTTDIILAASLLKQIILDLNTLDINISTDIKRQLARSA